jgi:hypothetical protein
MLSQAESNPALRKFRIAIAVSWTVKVVAGVLALYLLAHSLGAQ